ncbi:MAG: hypothetical protein HY356_02215 [Gammaproteobacteria bacterium]|nr:hypothetical protein [Gammaproteobacteria bacterium]
MGLNNILTIIGITATVALGAWAVYLAKRFSRQVGIAYVEDSCLSLIDDITKGIKELKILFRDAPVSHSLVLLKGYFVNTGKRDIAPAMVEKRFRLTLPENFEWIDCQITDQSKDLKVTVAEVSSNAIEFDFGLLKTQEFFKFDALATVPTDEGDNTAQLKVPPNSKLRAALDFDYRIADTGNIQRLRLSDLRSGMFLSRRMTDALADHRLPRILQLYSWILSLFWLGMGMILVIFGLIMFFVFQYDEPKRIAYQIAGPENQEVIAAARVKDGQIELYDQASFRRLLSPEEFDKLQKTTVIESPGEIFMILVPFSYAALGGLMLIIWIVQYARTLKYRRILRLAK